MPEMSDNVKKTGCVCLALVGFVSVILFACSFSLVSPIQYGLLINRYTGKVDTSRVYTGGRHFVYLRHYFVLFPSTQVTLEFSNDSGAAAPPMLVRTGKPPGMAGVAGGQQVTVSLSLQYRTHPETLAKLYTTFGVNYEQAFIMMTRQIISDVTQSFIPSDFWTQRHVIAQNMTAVLNQTMWNRAFVTVDALQLLEVDFSHPFEHMIEQIQLQWQQVQINDNLQLVQDALNVIDVMTAQTQANVTAINAQAQADAKLIVAAAEADALRVEQLAKSGAYANVKSSLKFTDAADLLSFMRVRTIRNHNGNNLIVGTQSP